MRLGGRTALQRWLVTRGLAVLLVVALDYGALAIVLHDAGIPLMVLTGGPSPFEVGYPWLSVPLRLLGYLLVPALLGAITAFVVEGQLKELLLDREEAQQVIRGLLQDSNGDSRPKPPGKAQDEDYA